MFLTLIHLWIAYNKSLIRLCIFWRAGLTTCLWTTLLLSVYKTMSELLSFGLLCFYSLCVGWARSLSKCVPPIKHSVLRTFTQRQGWSEIHSGSCLSAHCSFKSTLNNRCQKGWWVITASGLIWWHQSIQKHLNTQCIDQTIFLKIFV